MKPTMKKWLTGLLSAALLAGNLQCIPVNTAYAAEEDGFFTDEARVFWQFRRTPKTHGQVRILLQVFLNLPGLPPGSREDFSGGEGLVAPDSRRVLKGSGSYHSFGTDAQDEGGYLQNLTLYTNQRGASTRIH